MQSMSINDRQSRELCDEIGKALAIHLDSDVVRNKVSRIVSDYVKQKDIGDDPEKLARKISWSVKVEMKK